MKAKGIMSSQFTVSNNSKKNPFSAFKVSPKIKRAYMNYRVHRVEPIEPNTKSNALIGSVAGVGLGMAAIAKMQELPLSNVKTYFKLKYGVKEMVIMSGLAIIGGVVGGMKGSSKKKEKMNEGVFQFMNATVPLLAVTPAVKLLDALPFKQNKILRITTILGSLLLGMKGAAELSNFINDPNDLVPDRKLTMKDAIANVDDTIGAFAVAKVPIVDKVEKLLPAIYAWCGYRAGQSN